MKKKAESKDPAPPAAATEIPPVAPGPPAPKKPVRQAQGKRVRKVVKQAPGKAGRPRKPEKGRVYARSMDELGRLLAPPRDRKIIQRGMKLPGCPGRSADGRYDIKAWQDFINRNFDSAATVPDKVNHEIERLKLQNERMALENSIRRGQFIDVEECCQILGDAFAAFASTLLNSKNTLAPQVVGVTPGEASKRIGLQHRAALQKLSVPDWTKKKAFWRTVSERLSDLRAKFLPGDGASSTSSSPPAPPA